MNKKIIFTAGGTGGHLLPAINLMKHFSEKGNNVILVTDKRGNKYIKNFLDYKSYVFKAGTATNKNIFKKFLSFFVILGSLIKSVLILFKEKPDLVIGFGGYVSFPISFVSKLFNSPLIIYENNLVFGRANKFLLKFAKKILTAKPIKKDFPEKYRNKIYIVGSILDKNIINYSSNKKNMDDGLSILILGGSQGAEIFGTVVPTAIKMVKEKGFLIEVNQQCIKSQKNIIINYYKKNDIKNYVFEFENNILELISSANLAITRCGASATAELAHTATPFIGVPLKNSIDNHQFLNAKFYEEMSCCWILEEKNFNEKNLFNLIMEIVNNKNKLKNIRSNIKKKYNNVYANIESQIKEFI